MQGNFFIQDLAVILVVAGIVGWICQRMGLSAVVGFLAAGILIGPGNPYLPRIHPYLSLVSDTGGVQTLARLGLVFLMFSIGLRLSLRKLRRLGLPLLLAVFGSATAMYYLSRLLGAILGWSSTEGLFLAGILMISSSAIVGKVLHETSMNHERAGQLAMGVSILEDVVAVVMLTMLHSVVRLGGTGPLQPSGMGLVLAQLGAFVALIGIAGLLFVPWLLKRMSIVANEELQTLGLAALLFGLAVLADRAGYSLALGAFLLGIIIAETPHRHQAERTFEGMRDVFTAVFFVAMGMQIHLPELIGCGGLIIGVSAFTLLARPVAVTGGLCLIGVPFRDSMRAGLMATPIGEFSFIIAQQGVLALVIPPRFYTLAVGVSLLTTLVAPLLVRYSSTICDAAVARQPQWFGDWLRYYQGWLERLMRHQHRSPFWQLTRKRFVQIGIEMLFVTGLVVFSGELFGYFEGMFGHNWGIPHGSEIIFCAGLCLLILAPLFAIWRNCSALALLCAQVSTHGHPRARQLAPVVETGLKVVAAGLLAVWLLAIIPAEDTARWLLLGSALFAVAVLFILRRKLIYWHCVLEVELQNVIETSETKMTATTAPWLKPHTEWNLHMVDCTLPDLADCQGRSIAELDLRARFGCSVVGIERQGFMIPLPKPEAILYPRDKVLLLGTQDQVRVAQAFLGAVSANLVADSLFEEVRMDAIPVPPGSPASGRVIGELSPTREFGIQIAGIHRAGVRILNPSAQETIQTGDELLCLATPVQLREFKAWLGEVPGALNG